MQNNIYIFSRSNQEELYHHGVKGMKWGVRKYQNSDGTLTDIGKNKVSKEYRKYLNKASKDINKGYSKRYRKAYNEAANEMNNGKAEQYNKEYDKKLGKRATNHDYVNDKSYLDGYEKLFEKTMSKHYNRALIHDICSNSNYKKAQLLCTKYSMEKFDDYAKSNLDDIEQLRKQFR